MRRFFAAVVLGAVVIGCGGKGGTVVVWDVNGPLTIVHDPPIVRANTSTQFVAFGEGHQPSDFEWRTAIPSPRMTLDGVYSPGDALGMEIVTATVPGMAVLNRVAKTIPENVAVVFASDISGQSEIWLINEDGTGLMQWTTDGGSEPVGSTDQDRFYYKKGQQIWALTFISGTPLGGLFADFNDELQPLEVAHKWDGSSSGWAAFVLLRYSPAGGPVEYHLMTNGPGGPAFLLITDMAVDSFDNGNYRTVLSMGPVGARQLFLAPPVALRGVGTEPQQLTFGSLDCADPSNGLDGRTVYFSGHDGLQWDIYGLDQYSGVVTNLTNTPGTDEEHPALSPEGSRIAYSRGTGTSHEIWTMKTDGSDRRALVTGMGDCRHPDYMVLTLP